MVLSAVRPVESSSSTSTTGPGRCRKPGSAGSTRCSVACECASSKPRAAWNPGTRRRVEWIEGQPRARATRCPSAVAVSAYPSTHELAGMAPRAVSSGPTRSANVLRIDAVTQHPTQLGGDRRIDGRPAQELTDPQPEQKSAATDDPWVGGHMLGQHRRHQQLRPLRVDPQGKVEQVGEREPREQAGVRDLDPGVVADEGGHRLTLASSRSTKLMSSWATPNARARNIVACAQARCGLDSFILLRYFDADTPPPAETLRTSRAST